MQAPSQYGGCQMLYDVSVTIDVTEDIYGTDGFGFQLNAYSPETISETDGGTLPSVDTAQQYCIIVDPNASTIFSMIDNWDSYQHQLINHSQTLASIKNATIPKGYKLSIQLQTDYLLNVSGVTFTVYDQTGAMINSYNEQLLSVYGVTQDDLAPIVAFQLDLVDYINGQNTQLLSGAGVITYKSGVQLTAGQSIPSCVPYQYSTLETSNAQYGEVPNYTSHSFSQSFATNLNPL
jgi:hypothetical protein